jgi:hypothetical protein
VVNAAWAVLFLYAVAVQYNDPDPLAWMFLYGVGALFCGVAAVRGDIPIRPVVGWAVVSLGMAALDGILGTGQTDPMGGFPHWGALRDEVVREVLGLMLMTGWMVALAVWTHRRRTVP